MLAAEGSQRRWSAALLPTDRGSSTVYAQVTDGRRGALSRLPTRASRWCACARLGKLAPRHVVNTPGASLTPAWENLLIVVSVIDNLLKGAASQAVQNFNLMWNLPETTGLVAC